ncbi:hypothetical protein [Bradyrhizobium sp.]|uniref:hypothetical protein n=1 Tax=Bradyrhizobium sp. TaxID=376 RepID=UPI001D67B105|nr:hypothetical protein [Bradyrhizobium sp.]MBV8696336.1 hypothetical protein [Bradyrhizobium sp.]MBV8922712.1 hypothetical protein [Bradyrhizobium sp.]MBV9985283.1 hypothetical protein [Bradyrhizobium sp.]
MSASSPPVNATAMPPELEKALKRYRDWARTHLLAEQDTTTITETLYHYTDLVGLEGILKTSNFWFTDYRRLNDPSELKHGIDIARDVARGMSTGADASVRLFLDCLLQTFEHDTLASSLEFFIAFF